jgi:hypothetical protein
MNEGIGSAVIRCDETIAFVEVENFTVPVVIWVTLYPMA